MRVLILEDDKPTAEFLQKGFTEAGFNAALCAKGADALSLATTEEFDIAVVDVMVPGMSGLQVVDQLRRQGRDMPILFLSAKRELEDRLEGLRRGADDYLTKPFSFSELLARCQAVLRRSSKPSELHKLAFHDIEMDLLRRTVSRRQKQIELHQKEFALLEYLIRNPGRVLTKAQILQKVWHYNFDPQTNVVDVLICRLRRKLEDGSNDRLIRTIRGVGYVLQVQ